MALKAYSHVSGEFVIPILRVRPDGEMVTSPKKIQATEKPSPSSSNASTRGPASKPYMESSARSQQGKR